LNSREFLSFDAIGLAEIVRNRQVSARELVEIAITRIEQLNPRLNAVVHTMFEGARRQADNGTGEGAFAGVPILLKDLLAWYAGERITSGSRLYRDFLAPEDTEVVRRYRSTGAIVLGKTNTPEFGLTPYCESEVLGARNPWNPERTPGGSSGGSAVAVAVGMVPLAGGGDGGGSIRIPASCTGIFGMKPTRGRVPTGPRQGELWNGASIESVLTRSVRDSAAMLDALSGADVGAPYPHPPPRPSGGSRRPRGTASSGGYDRSFLGAPFIPTASPRSRMPPSPRSLGHETVDVTVPIERDSFNRNFVVMVCGEVAADLSDAERLLGHTPQRGELEYTTWALAMIGRSLSAGVYAQAKRDLQRAARRVGQFFESIDVLLTPTVASPPIKIGALQPPAADRTLLKALGAARAGRVLRLMGAVEKAAEQIFDWIPYTPLFNVTGQPAMSVPLWWNAEGLPVGVQYVGRFGAESTLYRLAAQLEAARPWQDRWPAMAMDGATHSS
jgi:amidase